ncbi:MAG: BON domain-containing protein [Planctomycetaceae bacterium]|nr:BON domain-containing protein [Planctomycetaceae bacterium]
MKKIQFQTVLSAVMVVGGFIFAWTATEVCAQTGNSNTSTSNNSSSNVSSSSSSGNSSSSSGSGSTGSFVTDFSLESMSFDASQGNSGFVGGGGNSDFIGTPSGTTGSRTTSSRNSYSSSNRSASRSNLTGATAGGYGGNRSNSRTQIQPVYTLGFTPPTRNQETISFALNSRLAGFSQTTGHQERFKTVQVTTENGTVVLNGTVHSEHDRKLAENVALLQPGVQKIHNELKINTTSAVLPDSSRSRQNSPTLDTIETTSPQQRQVWYVF